jgi:hypothetical protein
MPKSTPFELFILLFYLGHSRGFTFCFYAMVIFAVCVSFEKNVIGRTTLNEVDRFGHDLFVYFSGSYICQKR